MTIIQWLGWGATSPPPDTRPQIIERLETAARQFGSRVIDARLDWREAFFLERDTVGLLLDAAEELRRSP